MTSVVTFNIDLPLEPYEYKYKESYKDYAYRDTVTAIEDAKKYILDLMKLKRLPLNVKLKAIALKQSSSHTTFKIDVIDADEDFLNQLFDALYE